MSSLAVLFRLIVVKNIFCDASLKYTKSELLEKWKDKEKQISKI